MARFGLFLLVFVFSGSSLRSQSVPKKRQANWQQQVAYDIKVKLDDRSHELHAFETITYRNQSPNTLHKIYIHLWPNAYSNNQTEFAKQALLNRDFRFYRSNDSQKGHIDSLDFKVDGQEVTWSLTDQPDIAVITLNQPLLSGNQITLSTPFRVKIPFTFSRLGHVGQAYQITQWYPKPAVYDVNGWHPMPYLDQGEFYSEFGTFDVHITIPDNYVVAATGNLLTSSEKRWLHQKATEVPEGDIKTTFPASSKNWKTLHYQQDRIHDFAWFADKRFWVTKSEVTIPETESKVESWIYSYRSKNTDTVALNRSILHYSKHVGPYPYQMVSVVEGPLSAGGGMEYPTITIMSSINDQVVVHEVGHNWFYGILGSDEREYSWMDEGINSYYENRYFAELPEQASLAGKEAEFVLKLLDLEEVREEDLFYILYLVNARKRNDQPIELEAAKYTGANYGAIVYGKAAIGMKYLEQYLGQDVFDKAMKAYYQKWQFRHPLPGDLQDVLEQVSGKKLNWFFDEFTTTTGRLDYSISGIKKGIEKNDTTFIELTIRNKGDLIAPFSISGYDGKHYQNPIWFDGFKGKKQVLYPANNFQKFRIDAGQHLPEFNRKNNVIRRKGLLKQVEPLRLQLAGSLENPEKTQLYFNPILGWNHVNKLMIGAAFYNSLQPQKTFEYVVAPLFAFEQGEVVGYAQFMRHFYPRNSFLKRITLGVDGSRFDYLSFAQPTTFEKFKPFITTEFNRRDLRYSINRSLTFSWDAITLSSNESEASSINQNFYNLTYEQQNKRVFNPFDFKVHFQYGSIPSATFSKLSFESHWQLDYQQPKKRLEVRLFAGTFLHEDNLNNGLYFWRLSDVEGIFDYTFDRAQMGRGAVDGVFDNQVMERDGFFRSNAPIGITNEWMAAANLNTTLPGKIPFELFLDMGTYANAANSFTGSQAFVYNGGVMVTLINNAFEIYVPFFYSSDIKQVQDLQNRDGDSALKRLGRRVTFRLNLNALNPLKRIRTFELTL